MRVIVRMCLPILLVLIAGQQARGLDDLILDGPDVVAYVNGEHEYNEVRVINGATLFVNEYGRGRDFLYITCATFTLDELSRIDGAGLGRGSLGNAFLPAPNMPGNGGSYGGQGGAGDWVNAGRVFGTTRGLDIGVGGHGFFADGTFTHSGLGSPGGAAFKVIADTCILLGTVNMNGKKGDAYGCSPRDWTCSAAGGGGGAGGGILIAARRLQIGNSARLTANGGQGGYDSQGYRQIYGFAGGGGRIKIFHESGDISPESVLTVDPGFGFWAENAIEATRGSIWIQQVPSIRDLLHPNADFNADGIVNETDLTIFMEHWHLTVPVTPPGD